MPPPNPGSNARRGRGRSAEPNIETTPDADSGANTIARITRKRTPRSNLQSSVEPESKPQVSTVTEEVPRIRVRSKAQHAEPVSSKAGSAKGSRGTRAKIEAVDEDDPLDSIGSPESEAQEKSGESSKAKRGTRSKTTSKAAKEAEASQSTGIQKTPAAGDRTTRRTRGSPAELASPDGIGTDSGINKENAPDTGVEAEQLSSEKATKVRVSRTRKAAAGKVKDEPISGNIPSPDVAPVTKTRVTRTRARK